MNESIQEALSRQLNETLGNEVSFEIPPDPQPVYVAQYFTNLRNGWPMDPRKHSIGLTFCFELFGKIKPSGESLEFAWFDVGSFPPSAEFGFGQELVVRECLARFPVPCKTRGSL